MGWLLLVDRPCGTGSSVVKTLHIPALHPSRKGSRSGSSTSRSRERASSGSLVLVLKLPRLARLKEVIFPVPVISFTPPRRRRLQKALLAEARSHYRNQVPKSEALARLRKMAEADKRALESPYFGRGPYGSEESKAVTNLLIEAAGRRPPFIAVGSTSPEERELEAMTIPDAFALLANMEPRLRDLDDEAVRVQEQSINLKDQSINATDVYAQFERELNNLMGPEAGGAQRLMKSTIARSIAMLHLMNEAGLSEDPGDSWWPWGP